MRTRFSRQASEDLRRIVREIAAASPRAARRVRHDISRSAERLADNPALGPLVGPGALRRIVVSPYLLFYQASSHDVTIVRVLHGARDIDRVLRETDPVEPDAYDPGESDA